MMRRLSPAWGWCLVTNRVKKADISIWEAFNLENNINWNVSLHLCVRQSLSWCWPAGATSPRAAWRTWVSAASAPPPSPWRTCSPPGYTSQWVCPSPTVICSVNIYTWKFLLQDWVCKILRFNDFNCLSPGKPTHRDWWCPSDWPALWNGTIDKTGGTILTWWCWSFSSLQPANECISLLWSSYWF